MKLQTSLDIGQALKRLRQEQGFDQSDLGSYIGVSDRTVRNIEKGAEGTKTGSLLLAARELGLKLYLSEIGQSKKDLITSLTSVGQRARKVRKEQGIRQDDLASIVGIQHSVLGRIERGDDTVAIGTILKVLHELGLRLSSQE